MKSNHRQPNHCIEIVNTFTYSPRLILFTVQGLADAFIKMRLPFESPEAAQLNKDIFETIYFGAVNASVEVLTPHTSRT